MKKLIALFTLIVSCLFISDVKANSINSINMDIYIDQNGDAYVIEEWYANITSGTEGYKPYYNLGQSNITDFRVSMNKENFTSLDNWNTSLSFNDKAYKNGINSLSDGLELCFGISRYGTNNYKLEYTIKNFVYQTNDSDMVYFTLMPHDFLASPKEVYIKIHSNFDYEDSLDVWGYGYEGYAYVYDGYIEMSTSDKLDSDEYMVTLIKFPKGTFQTSAILDSDFNHYLTMAEEGATKSKLSNTMDIVFNLLVGISLLLIWPVIIIFIIYSSKKQGYSNQKYRLEYGAEGNKLKGKDTFRDIPCEKNIFLAYYIAFNYGIIKSETHLYGALLLKWVKEQKVKVEKRTVSKLIKKEEATAIIIDGTAVFDNEYEKQLYDMMYKASKDGVLESGEFEKYCKNHYSKILNWFTEVLNYQADTLIKEGHLIKQQKKVTFLKYDVYEVDEYIREEAKKLHGLKNFLLEFTNVKDKDMLDVHLLDEYLMFAALFGITDKVAKLFKDLYPDYTMGDSMDIHTILFLNRFTLNSVNAATTAKSRAESYSSGGGGFSSSGGGGGSFGGGGGGGGFR